MSDDLIAIIACCILGLMAHGANRQPWLEWVLRVTYALFILGEAINIMADPLSTSEQPWNYGVQVGTAIVSTILLFKPGRQLISLILTFTNQLIAGRFLVAACGRLQEAVPPKYKAQIFIPLAEKKQEGEEKSSTDAKSSSDEQSSSAAKSANEKDSADSPSTDPDPKADTQEFPGSAGVPPASASAAYEPETSGVPPAPTPPEMRKVGFFQSFFAERIFVAESIPHMNALWIYVTCLAFLLTHMEIAGFQMPSIMVPIPVTMDQLFSYNFLGLIMLAICGTGIFISRRPMEVLRRLGLVKPTFVHILIGIVGIFITFLYDYAWSTYTHAQDGLGYADKLSHYNEGTFTSGASPGPAFLVASATGLCAGLGEEILIRGALQPALGIIPAAFMHGVLHGQFSHAPLLILQVFGWSVIMSIIRRYTNTTTTIITHVGFNFLSTFLIAFNP